MSAPRRLTIVIGANPPPRLDKALSRDTPEEAGLSRSRLAKLIAEGGVSRGGQVLTNPRDKVAEGDAIDLSFEPPRDVEVVAQTIPLDIRYEDDDLIVINKPVGMVVHPAPGTPDGTLVNALMAHCGDTLSGIGGEKRPGIVHRIDKDTSGLIVAAKSDKAHTGLAAQFEAHTVDRHYKAIVYGVPDAGDPRLRGLRGIRFEGGNILKITTQLARHKTDRQKQAVLFQGGRHAVTRARVEEVFGTPGAAAQVDCWLETGRTHQIRVHLAYAGFGLIGDQTYGGRRKLSEAQVGAEGVTAAAEFPRQALHAASLGFIHPISSEKLTFEAAMPEDMCALAQSLRGFRA